MSLRCAGHAAQAQAAHSARPGLALMLAVAVPAFAQATAKATFAGGCFWCVESDFDKVPGVISTTSGYTGGTVAQPTYEQVSAKGTGHAEAVEIVFDPSKVSYEQLLARYWRSIDPTTKDRQFCDVGSPYRTVIFTHDAAQLEAARRSLRGAGEDQALQGGDRHPDRAGRPLLRGRGLPPGLLQEEPRALPVLPHQLRPRRAAQAVVGEMTTPPEAPAALPPGGDDSGPAKPVPRRVLDSRSAMRRGP